MTGMECLLRKRREDGSSQLVPDRRVPQPGQREVFVFPGYKGSKKRSFIRLAGLMKLVEQALGVEVGDEQVAIIGINYRFLPPLTKQFDLNIQRQFLLDPEHYVSPDAHEFAQQVLVPRLFADQEKPPVTTLQERMSHLTFVAQSFGSVVTQMIGNALSQTLQARGYTAAEIKTICRSGVSIPVAGTSFVHTQAARFTECTFHATNDRKFQTQGDLLSHIFPNNVERIRQGMGISNLPDGLSCRSVPTGILVTSQVPTLFHYHDGAQMKILGKVQAGPKDATHMPQTHWCLPLGPIENGQVDNSLAVKLKHQALQNAVKRSPGAPDPVALITEGPLLSVLERMFIQKQFAADKVRGVA